jgi:ParB family chromosome partitioning protein
MNDLARRGLGRGLSALLGGEPVRVDGAPSPIPTVGYPSAPTAPASPLPEPVSTYTPPSVASPMPPATVTPSPTPSALTAPPPASQPITPTPAPAPAPAPTSPPAALAGEGGPRMLPIELVHRNPDQPRRHIDDADLEELAASIRAHGVLQPILVRPRGGGTFEIVAGERRWRAAQRAGLHVVPALVRDLEEVEVLEIAIIENVQRTDLNPLEEAHGYQALIDRFGRTQQEIADQVGKSRPHIANTLRLLALPGEIQDMVRDGRLSAGHARAILTAPDPMQLARLAVANALSVREIEKMAANAKIERDGARPTIERPEKDADTRQLEHQISQQLGLPVTIIHKGEAGGEIRIVYKRLDQLDDIVRRLNGALN